MPARNAAVTIASLSVAIIAAGAAVAIRWRARAAAAAWRAGFGAGLAWSVIRSLAAWLAGGVRRRAGVRPALIRGHPGAQAGLESVLEAPPPGDLQPGEQRHGDLG
jgi:hypothetical protein